MILYFVFTTECISKREMEDTVLVEHGLFNHDIKISSIMTITTPASLERRETGITPNVYEKNRNKIVVVGISCHDNETR